MYQTAPKEFFKNIKRATTTASIRATRYIGAKCCLKREVFVALLWSKEFVTANNVVVECVKKGDKMETTFFFFGHCKVSVTIVACFATKLCVIYLF